MQGVAEFDLSEAEDLESARRLVASGPYKAILLDVRLPDGSGPISCPSSSVEQTGRGSWS